MITLQLFLQIERKEDLTSEHLGTCTLEMMIDQFHLVNLPFQELHSKFPRNLNTVMRIGLVCQSGVLTNGR